MWVEWQGRTIEKAVETAIGNIYAEQREQEAMKLNVGSFHVKSARFQK